MRIYLNPVRIPNRWNRRTEWVFAACTLGWGLVLFAPGGSFEAPSYSVMAAWAPENVWAIGCTILGSIRLGVLFVNGRWARCCHVRAVTAGLTCFLWASVWLGLVLSVTNAPGLAIYFVFLVTDMFTVYEAMGDAREADEARNGGP